jgi:PIN domain nuclease of toxin-antitoxin system
VAGSSQSASAGGAFHRRDRLAAQQLPLPYRDPADWFQAATVLVMKLTLVTSDELLLGLETIRTMKN